ncbi:Uncharacterized conserved protein PhnB, glyoxalase superfamily [Andreprevotia lacus DSM 23236]|jgi:uncharacterized glyoxalase superfamily protein PhnB|uniref:Uncharacterized conserved protein PhnB, glyoxalase superfamily n=1 Tax=Andreprevotia lacus DSM 23236 TaxID=1121001 RepID=A0A1W1XYQ3_9NEIS|nr:VOC family protein [Andreprevotia lacus]SMC29100.1 Uncharacterized conserved protein PhnB, glyoxalase superfamily [Andreprevotia lacus DSM 23236]
MASYKPAQHNAVSPYLVVNDAPATLAFLANVFEGIERYRMEDEHGSIRHAEVQIDDSIIMVCERPGGEIATVGSVHVYVPDVDACYARALAAGATSLVEPQDQHYGDRSAGVQDAQGNVWWLGTHLNLS